MCWGWYHRDGLTFHQKTSEHCLAYQIFDKQTHKDWEAAKSAVWDVRRQKEQQWREEQAGAEEDKRERAPDPPATSPAANIIDVDEEAPAGETDRKANRDQPESVRARARDGVWVQECCGHAKYVQIYFYRVRGMFIV